MRRKFSGNKDPVIGLGTELQIINTTNGMPMPKAWEIVAAVDDPRVRIGLFESVMEIDSHLHPTVEKAIEELGEIIQNIRSKCETKGLTLLSTGSHPTARWDSLPLTMDPDRQRLLDRLAWVGKRMAIFGLRIHVGVPDGEKAIAIMGGLRVMIPLFVALSASSPYWNGHDTGLASVRSRIIENVPNAGIPPKIINWAEFVRFVKTLRAAEAIHDFSEIWWDVRPALSRGTIRIQACDSPHTLREMSILASLAFSTVHTLLNYYREGERIMEHEHWLIRENKWRASRFGLESELIASVEGEVMPLRDFLEMSLEKVMPAARSLGCQDSLNQIEEILAYGPGYIRQRMMQRVLGPEEATLAIAKEFEKDMLATPDSASSSLPQEES